MPGPKPPKARAPVPRSGVAAKAARTRLPEAPGTAADEVDAQLARYRAMRDFGTTAEPSGAALLSAKKPTLSGGLPFVIQKHEASHLHYDFRLGWAGVLKSWACAKGPSYVTADRRLAVQVEDHPMEYGGFEGTIPKGQYGGGTVMVWDQGTWWPQPGHENVDAGLRDGSLKFEMNGLRMKGKWTLVRMNARPGEKGGRWGSAGANAKPNWLLIKEHDAFERAAGAPAITEEAVTSAVTGRTMEQIAAETDHVWNSKETAGTGQAWYRRAGSGGGEGASTSGSGATNGAAPAPKSKTARAKIAESDEGTPPAPRKAKAAGSKADDAEAAGKNGASAVSARLAKLPRETQATFVSPQLAQEAESPPNGSGWVHELKLDGYRIQARKTGAAVALMTRSGLDWTHRVPSVAAAVARIPTENVTLDGEVVVLAEDGTTNFARLQASFQDGERNPLTYFCFDLLHLEGRNVRELPLVERKALLAEVLGDPVLAGHDEVRFSDHIDSGGEAVFQKACELHAEGIISKRATAAYSAGRSGDWLKSKCLHEQEFVVGGFTLSSDGPDRVGSLLLGYYDGDKLIYAGRSGTGFTQKSRRSLRERLAPMERKTAAFTKVPTEARRGALWVEPRLVAQVRFASWTAEDLLRQAAFLGLREDKAPEEVIREEAAPKRKGSGAQRSAVASEADHEGKAEEDEGEAPAESAPAPKKRGKKLVEPAAASAPASLRLTHPAKVLDPESGLTKQELADYYWAVASHMLPHIAGRPLSLVRCPDGVTKPSFYQKHVNHMLPPGVTSVDIPDKKTGKIEPYITLHTAEALAGLAQMGVLEIHPWGSRNDDLEHPDRLIFDLDPDEGLPWTVVCAAAAEVRARLTKIGLASFLKTTGGKGLHIVAPIEPEVSWTDLKNLAQLFVLSMERDAPQRYLTRMTKAARKGKIYLDYLRNERGATAVAPLSPRARLGVHASVPLPWTALTLGERPVFPVRAFPDWKGRLRADPWKALPTTTQRLVAERVKKL